MKWPWAKRREPISLAAIQALIRHEVARQLEIELSPNEITEPTNAIAAWHEDGTCDKQPPVNYTRNSKLVQALDAKLPHRIFDAINRWVRQCARCDKPFLVPREAAVPMSPMSPGPTDTRKCQECSEKLG